MFQILAKRQGSHSWSDLLVNGKKKFIKSFDPTHHLTLAKIMLNNSEQSLRSTITNALMW